eukprot:SAG31_NODE_15997_length_728_cov_0.755167_1_plen_140_part_00
MLQELSATILQAVYRGRLVRRRSAHDRLAEDVSASEIDSELAGIYYRAESEQRGAVAIQAAIRGHAVRSAVAASERRQSASMKIQQVVRGRRGRAKGKRARREQQWRDDAAARIQALARGTRDRCATTKNGSAAFVSLF